MHTVISNIPYPTYIPRLPSMQYQPYMPYIPYLPYIPNITYIPNIPCIPYQPLPNIHAKHQTWYSYIPYSPYPPCHIYCHTYTTPPPRTRAESTPPPYHRGGGGQYYGWPMTMAGGGGGLERWTVYMYVCIYICVCVCVCSYLQMLQQLPTGSQCRQSHRRLLLHKRDRWEDKQLHPQAHTFHITGIKSSRFWGSLRFFDSWTIVNLMARDLLRLNYLNMFLRCVGF